jgi:hypothetical protein
MGRYVLRIGSNITDEYMNIWILLSVFWAGLLLFMFLSPQRWHALMLKDRDFFVGRNLISESLWECFLKFTTGIWCKITIFIILLLSVFNAFYAV